MHPASVLLMLEGGRVMRIPGLLKRGRWVGGLVFVLTLLAHDVLMAAAPHAGPEEPLAPSGRHIVAAHQSTGQTDSQPDEQPPSEHPRECGTAGIAVSPGTLQLDDVDEGAIACSGTGVIIAPKPAAAHDWVEPVRPPGVRRALLQVYRI
jgi:hypothetical protein